MLHAIYCHLSCCIIIQQSTEKRRLCCDLNLIWSFEFISLSYDLTSSSIETAIRGREKAIRPEIVVQRSTKCYQDQIQWTGNEIVISPSAVQVVINLKLRSYCLVSCPQPPPVEVIFSDSSTFYVKPVACNPTFSSPKHPCLLCHRAMHALTDALSLFLHLFLLFFGYNTKSTVTYPYILPWLENPKYVCIGAAASRNARNSQTTTRACL